MKYIQNLFKVLLIFVPAFCMAQKIDTTFYGGKIVKRITHWNATKDTVRFRDWYINGRKMSDVICIKEQGRWIPLGNATIYYQNGSKVQVYKKKTNNVFTYDTTGKLIASIVFDYKKRVSIRTTFFLNGKKKTEDVNNLEYNGENVITGLFYGYSASNDRCIIYLQSLGSGVIMNTYHPNGKSMQLAKVVPFSDKTGGYWKYDFYFQYGKLDTSTTYLPWPDDPYYKHRKEGTWINYYANGQIQKKEFYHNDQLENEQWYWYENGQLNMYVVYQNGRYIKLEKYTIDGKKIE